MTNPQRAAQYWPVLVLAARNRQLLTYGMMHDLTGMAMNGQGPILGLIVKYCKAHNLPKLTTIVVREETGLPADEVDEPREVCRKQAQVFAYPWRDGKAPSAEDFEEPALAASA